jgi:hypothetical protein
MEKELKRVVQTVNSLSLLYWQPSEFQSQARIRSLGEDWRQAFNWFLSSYAFERQGRSPHYSTAAVKAVELYKEELPNQDFEKEIWQNFCNCGGFSTDGKGANTKNNPLFPSKNQIESASGLIVSLENYDFNIVKWASSLAISDDIELAWNKLVKIRGIGNKIASLFLRDIVYAFEINEDKIKGKVYLQPIDVWTERGAKALAQFLSRTPNSYWEFAKVLVEVSEYAAVRPTLTNVGLWIFGAQLVRDEKRFHNLLLSPDDLHRFLSAQIQWHQNQAKALEMVLTVPGSKAQ